MDDILQDDRFSHVLHDPRFKRIPKVERKVKIDRRFQSMFTDKKFQVKYTIDKRGRPISHTSGEDLKKYYDISSPDESDSESSSEEDLKQNKTTKKISEEIATLKSAKDLSENVPDVIDRQIIGKEGKVADKVKERLQNMTIDYARGEGLLLTDSSSDEESSDEQATDEEDLEHEWGELDKDAEHTDEITNRLAVCHMDWDRIRAVDLFVLLNSFLPSGGIICQVAVYPSEFGLKRMKEEEEKGPLELREAQKCPSQEEVCGDGSDDENEEGSKYHMEKLRKYQLLRLKYYYAIVTCDSPATANKLYTECDGLEYESSATRLDLRFVPDDTTFDQKPREICSSMPDVASYQPRLFTTTALQQAKVELTWDETDLERKEFAQKMMSGKVDGISEKDLQDFLASSSGEEEEDNSNTKALDPSQDVDNKDADPLNKYRLLAQSLVNEEEKKESNGIEMEISWGLGVQEKAEELVKKKLKAGSDNHTPFQQYLEKRKEKKIKKREGKKLRKGDDQASETEDNSDIDDAPSDIDMNDPYFKEEFQSKEFKSSKVKNKRKTINSKVNENTQGDDREKAELELLMLEGDGDDSKYHFNMKSIKERETEVKKKKRCKKGKREATNEQHTQAEDNFDIDVKDERFSALFTSHLYNIDPTDPNYHKTKAMEALRAEKLKRRNDGFKCHAAPKLQKSTTTKICDSELTKLVTAVKRKTQRFNQ